MATIPEDRIVAERSFGIGPPQVPMQVAASQSVGVPGATCILVSGKIDCVNNNAVTSGIVGLLESQWSTAQVPAVDDPVQVTLLLPGYMFEATISGTAATTNIGAGYEIKSDAGGVGFTIIDGGTTTAKVFNVVAFPGEVSNAFSTGMYIAEAGTSPTAGSLNQPLAAKMGVIGDTNARCWAVSIDTNTVWAA